MLGTEDVETPSRFAGLASAAAASRERRGRPFQASSAPTASKLPQAQEGTWSAYRNRGSTSTTNITSPAPTPTVETPSLTVPTVVSIELCGNTPLAANAASEFEVLLRDLGVTDEATIQSSIKLQTKLGLHNQRSVPSESGEALRKVVYEDMDEVALRESLSYRVRNDITETGLQQACASWTAPVVPVIAACSYLEHVSAAVSAPTGRAYLAYFKETMMRDNLNVTAGVFPPGVGPLDGNTTFNLNDCGVTQPAFCRIPPPGAASTFVPASTFLLEGELHFLPPPAMSETELITAITSCSTVSPIQSTWMLSNLGASSQSSLTVVDPMNPRTYISSALSTAIEMKLKSKEVQLFLQLLSPPPESVLCASTVDTDLPHNSLSHSLGMGCRRHHWKPLSLIRSVDSTKLASATQEAIPRFTVNCRSNLLYLCGFLLSKQSKNHNWSASVSPHEEALFAVSDDSFGSGIPGVVGIPSDVHTMERSNFLSLLDRNKEVAGLLLQHLFNIKNGFSETAEDPWVDMAPTGGEEPFNDTERFYGRLAYTYRSCLNALLWLPVLSANSLESRGEQSPRARLLRPLNSQMDAAANLVVSEPLCYVVKFLSELDNELLYGSAATSFGEGVASPPVLSAAEFATLISAATSALMAMFTPSPPTPIKCSASSTPPASAEELDPTKTFEQDAPTLMLGNEHGAAATVTLPTPTKSSGRANSGIDGSPEGDTTRTKRQCLRSAQLFALLMNNIILKRARAIQAWEAHQRREASASSGGSPSNHRSGRESPSTSPLLSLFFDGTVVELTSFAVHFRSVKECTELFQTLKRF